MKKQTEIMHTDVVAKNRTIEGLNQYTPLVKDFYKKFKEINPEVLKKTEDLVQALPRPTLYFVEYVKSLIPEKSPTGLPVDKEKTLQTLVMPDLSPLEELTLIMSMIRTQYSLEDPNSLYCIKNGEVEVNQNKLDQALLRHSIIVTENERAKIRFIELHKAAAQSFQNLREYASKQFQPNNSEPIFSPYSPQFDIKRILSSDGEKIDINASLVAELFERFGKTNNSF